MKLSLISPTPAGHVDGRWLSLSLDRSESSLVFRTCLRSALHREDEGSMRVHEDHHLSLAVRREMMEKMMFTMNYMIPQKKQKKLKSRS